MTAIAGFPEGRLDDDKEHDPVETIVGRVRAVDGKALTEGFPRVEAKNFW